MYKTDVQDFSGYNQYLINKYFSFFSDTILIISELNKSKNLSNENHFNILYSMVPKGKRYSKWLKEDNEKQSKMIGEFYNINKNKCQDFIKIVPPNEIESIINQIKMVNTNYKV